MPDHESALKPYSLGIVLVDKAHKSDNIQVVPIEKLHLDNGLITGQIRKFDIKAPDHKGIKRSTNWKISQLASSRRPSSSSVASIPVCSHKPMPRSFSMLGVGQYLLSQLSSIITTLLLRPQGIIRLAGLPVFSLVAYMTEKALGKCFV